MSYYNLPTSDGHLSMIITPTSIDLDVGQSVELSCDVAGGQPASIPYTITGSSDVSDATDTRAMAYHTVNGHISVAINATNVRKLNGTAYENYGTLPVSGTWESMAVNGNTVVVVASAGTGRMCYSLDGGVTWVNNTTGNNYAWKCVKYANGRFVAIGNGTVAGWSTDGITWNIVTRPTNHTFARFVSFGAGKWVSGGNGQFGDISSDNGTTWQQVDFGLNKNWQDACYCLLDNQWSVVDTNAATGSRRTSDSNAVTWVSGTLSGVSGSGIMRIFSDSSRVYVLTYVTGALLSSNDWTTWTVHESGSASRNARNLSIGGGVISTGNGGGTRSVITYTGGAATLTKSLIDTSDSSVLSTVSPYTYTGDIADNGKNFRWDVTDGVTTVQSALIPVAISVPVTDGSNKLVQGATEVPIFSRYGYKTEIGLRMDKTTDSRGIVRWLDDGRAYDSYKTVLTVRTEQPKEFEQLLCGDSISPLKITTPNDLGLFPFSMLYATDYDYPISVVSWKTGGDAVIGGEVCDYELSIVPAVRGVYDSFPKATDLGGCIISAWQIGTVDFPFSDWEPELNDYRRVIELNGNTSELVDTARTYGDIAKIKVNCSEEQARRIIAFFVSTMRGSEQTATFPDSYHIFGRRYSGMTTCKVRLYEPILTVTHALYESVDIEFTLQMVGV